MKRFSRKRQAILEAIRSTKIHPSAEWLYMKLKPEYPDLSLATVYRNIAEFMEDGTVISVGTVSGQERYDGNLEPHAHFFCDGCGSVIDIPEPHELIDDKYIGSTINALITRHETVFHGRCEKCLNN